MSRRVSLPGGYIDDDDTQSFLPEVAPAEPETTHSESTQPEITQPEITHPDITQPESSPSPSPLFHEPSSPAPLAKRRRVDGNDEDDSNGNSRPRPKPSSTVGKMRNVAKTLMRRMPPSYTQRAITLSLTQRMRKENQILRNEIREARALTAELGGQRRAAQAAQAAPQLFGGEVQTAFVGIPQMPEMQHYHPEPTPGVVNFSEQMQSYSPNPQVQDFPLAPPEDSDTNMMFHDLQTSGFFPGPSFTTSDSSGVPPSPFPSYDFTLPPQSVASSSRPLPIIPTAQQIPTTRSTLPLPIRVSTQPTTAPPVASTTLPSAPSYSCDWDNRVSSPLVKRRREKLPRLGPHTLTVIGVLETPQPSTNAGPRATPPNKKHMTLNDILGTDEVNPEIVQNDRLIRARLGEALGFTYDHDLYGMDTRNRGRRRVTSLHAKVQATIRNQPSHLRNIVNEKMRLMLYSYLGIEQQSEIAKKAGVSIQDKLAFEYPEGHPDHTLRPPSLEDLRWDYMGGRKSKWNIATLEILVDDFSNALVERYRQWGVPLYAKDYIYWTIRDKMEQMASKWKKSRHRMLHDGRMETEAECSQRMERERDEEHKKCRQNSRRHAKSRIRTHIVTTLVDLKTQSNDRDGDLASMQLILRILQRLGPEGMSSEESDFEADGSTVYRVKILNWRSDLELVLNAIDQQRELDPSLYTKQGSKGVRKVRAPPRREYATLDGQINPWPITRREAVPDLPEVFYDATWLKSLTDQQKDLVLHVSREEHEWFQVFRAARPRS